MLDPNNQTEWDEPILANSRKIAKEKCKDLAKQYSKDGHPVELLDTEYIEQPDGAKNQQPNFRCKFRS